MESVRGSGVQHDATNVGDTGSEAIAANPSEQARVSPKHENSHAEKPLGLVQVPRWDRLGVYLPPECPLLVKHKARPAGLVSQNPATGDEFIGLTLSLPPLTPGGRDWLVKLGQSDFFKDLPSAILDGRVAITPRDAATSDELPRESAVAHLNNALQILTFLSDKLDAMYSASQATNVEVERNWERGKGDVRSIARRLVFALRELGGIEFDSAGTALNETARAVLLEEIADARQLALVDGEPV